MEKFFEAGTLTQEELVAGLKKATHGGKVFPLVCTSGLANIGMQPLLDAIVAYVPSPADRPFKAADAAGAELARGADEKAPYAAFVWKTVADQFAGRITMFRVYQGALKSDSTVQNATQAPRAAGPSAAAAGQDADNRAGDQGWRPRRGREAEGHAHERHDRRQGGWHSFAADVPRGGAVYAIEPKSRGDEDKINQSMHRLEEDPTIRYARDPQTHELLLAGPGPAAHRSHGRQAEAALRRRGEPQAAAHSLSRNDHRQGRGARPAQEADRRPRPVRRLQDPDGAAAARQRFRVRRRDLRRLDPAQFIPAVEKGIQESRLRGYLAGYPVVDFRVVLYDGQYHDVDSNELSFKTAGWLAFKDGMSKARPTLLEPIMNVEVYAPSDYAGDLMGDLNGRRGRIGGMEPRGLMTAIKAQVPMAEMLTYEQHLTSVTGGRGSYHMEFSHYDEVPSHQQQKIIAPRRRSAGRRSRKPE